MQRPIIKDTDKGWSNHVITSSNKRKTKQKHRWRNELINSQADWQTEKNGKKGVQKEKRKKERHSYWTTWCQKMKDWKIHRREDWQNHRKTKWQNNRILNYDNRKTEWKNGWMRELQSDRVIKWKSDVLTAFQNKKMTYDSLDLPLN